MTRGVGGESPSNIALHLKGIDFPCQKGDLVAHVRKGDPDPAVMKALDGLPDRKYTTMADVMEGFGEEQRS
ncbi:DUF2795 domain-containing protein [Mesoterricola silvestris]|uniref:DUF2795 domain-containing protein n=1 Tax=Mesoterricola silvestris TaxID=2927979 RepID=A0AA48GIU6_9BACT|nr:DUF2795 domain-containing protein [Mesoterricola silvestris]BDU71859.1 hypothetical protein METEAL_10330 [Mesoterricola silvestris]